MRKALIKIRILKNTVKTVQKKVTYHTLKHNTYTLQKDLTSPQIVQNKCKTVHEALKFQAIKQNSFKMVRKALT